MQYLVLGDSHSGHITRILREQGAGRRLFGGMLGGAWGFHKEFFEKRLTGLFSLLDETHRRILQSYLDDAAAQNLEAFSGNIIVELGLSSPIIGSLAKANFDFDPGYDGPSRRHISEAVVDLLVQSTQSFALEFYKHLHSTGQLYCAIAGPAMQARHPAYSFYGDRSHTIRARFEAPVRSYLASINCPIIEPSDAIQDDGCLKKDYWGPDWSHANEDFAHLILRDINKLIEARGQQA